MNDLCDFRATCFMVTEISQCFPKYANPKCKAIFSPNSLRSMGETGFNCSKDALQPFHNKSMYCTAIRLFSWGSFGFMITRQAKKWFWKNPAEMSCLLGKSKMVLKNGPQQCIEKHSEHHRLKLISGPPGPLLGLFWIWIHHDPSAAQFRISTSQPRSTLRGSWKPLGLLVSSSNPGIYPRFLSRKTGW